MASELNGRIADKLAEAADILSAQGANPFRVTAYRRAADTLSGLERDVAEIYEDEGGEGLEALPGIGSGIAAAIREMIQTGRWNQLERLRGQVDPEALLRTIPGIGPTLAKRIHDALDIDTLEALEQAAHDGRLGKVEGIGARTLAAIRPALAQRLGRARRARSGGGGGGDDPRPDVATLLEVDETYRRRSEAGELPTIAPKRFNPEGESWLPILHTEASGWHFTALYSNTARAHQLDKIRDWVVIYYYDDDHEERQCTIVTETRGALAGHRVVRGREQECRRHYEDAADDDA